MSETKRNAWRLDKALDGYETRMDGSCEVILRFSSEDEFSFFIDAMAKGVVIAGVTAPQAHVVGDLDYCFDPENWEFTCSWSERDQVHDNGESLEPGHPMRVCTLLQGPDKWVADVPITWDVDGEPDKTEIKWFDSEEDARAALATGEGPTE